jgi:recombination directionality factor gp3-like protein
LPGRILTLQRQVRELGRLRTGYTANGRPNRSKTWILTSKDRDLLAAAAEEWGGQVVEWTPLNSDTKQWSLTTETAILPAFLPPGDPLTQNLEMWSKGGAQRRCDGVTDSKSNKPCLCLAQFGENFHERDPREVCRPYSQLNLMLLNLPDIGVWRHVTKSFYAAGEIAGAVDLIKAQVGPAPIVPVWLIIDPRESVKDGKRTPYPVPAIKIRGATSGAALLSGQVPTLELGPARERVAIESGPAQPPATQPARKEKLTAAKVAALAALVRNVEQLQQLWKDAAADGALDEPTKQLLTARAEQLKNGNAAAKPVSAPPVETVEGEPEPDADALMLQILALSGAAPLRWSADRLEQAITGFCGKSSSDANGWELATFLDALKNGQVGQ